MNTTSFFGRRATISAFSASACDSLLGATRTMTRAPARASGSLTAAFARLSPVTDGKVCNQAGGRLFGAPAAGGSGSSSQELQCEERRHGDPPLAVSSIECRCAPFPAPCLTAARTLSRHGDAGGIIESVRDLTLEGDGPTGRRRKTCAMLRKLLLLALVLVATTSIAACGDEEFAEHRGGNPDGHDAGKHADAGRRRPRRPVHRQLRRLSPRLTAVAATALICAARTTSTASPAVREGGGGMPAFSGELTDAQIQALARIIIARLSGRTRARAARKARSVTVAGRDQITRLSIIMRFAQMEGIADRALLLAALADGKSLLRGALVADDTAAFVDGLRGLHSRSPRHAREGSCAWAGGWRAWRAWEARLCVGQAGMGSRSARFFVAGHGAPVFERLRPMNAAIRQPSSRRWGRDNVLSLQPRHVVP